LTVLVAIVAVGLGSTLALHQMLRAIFPLPDISTICVAQP
jgi:hypothetical protein